MMVSWRPMADVILESVVGSRRAYTSRRGGDILVAFMLSLVALNSGPPHCRGREDGPGDHWLEGQPLSPALVICQPSWRNSIPAVQG